MAGNKIIAIDLGGTYLRSAIVKNKKIFNYTKKNTPKNRKDLLKEITDSISKLMSKDVKGIGIASPGPLKNGTIMNTPNIPLKYFNLKSYLEKKFKKRIVIENDAKCVALAESKIGVRKKNFIILTLGTGIGGGIIINRELYFGCGNAGELGHIIIDKEKYMENLWKERRENISALLEKNDKKSCERISKYLGQGIASLINILDPEVVILAGGARESGDKLLRPIKKYARKYVILPRFPQIKWSKIRHPGIMGASLLIK